MVYFVVYLERRNDLACHDRQRKEMEAQRENPKGADSL